MEWDVSEAETTGDKMVAKLRRPDSAILGIATTAKLPKHPEETSFIQLHSFSSSSLYLRGWLQERQRLIVEVV